ncbi:hypothetical protein O5814_23210 [Escherichia coli]|nr:hypothetical protein [Escherichia coli]
MSVQTDLFRLTFATGNHQGAGLVLADTGATGNGRGVMSWFRNGDAGSFYLSRSRLEAAFDYQGGCCIP